MAGITKFINNIKNAVYGKEVRQSIADAIETCYDDATTLGNANMEVSKARGNYSNLGDRLDTEINSVLAATTDLQNQINAEKARINGLSSLEQGSTTGDAELQDIRIGYDGTTYNNAGTAVREQINDLNNDSLALTLVRRYSTSNTKSTYTLNSGTWTINGNPADEFKYAVRSMRITRRTNENILLIKCPGYYIRAISFTVNENNENVMHKLHNYTQNQVAVRFCVNVKDPSIVFCIRKNPNDSTELTQEDIEDIHSKLEIYTNDIIDKTLTVDNAAANSKSVGEKIAEVNKAIRDAVEYEKSIAINFVPRGNSQRWYNKPKRDNTITQ